jgi:hypothetical protein
MHASLAHVTAEYRIEKRDRVRYLEEYLADKSQYQIVELNREHERWLCMVTNNQAEEMIRYELFCEAQRTLTDCAAIERIRSKFDAIKAEKLARIAWKTECIRAKFERKMKAARQHCAMRCWTCADDGRAHPFEYRGKNYYRTYSGAMWHAGNAYEGNAGQLAAWAGRWNGLYISKDEEPQEKPAVARY